MIKKLLCLMGVWIIGMGGMAYAQWQEAEPLAIHSGEAYYDGKEMVLMGQVVVEHGLGRISARRFSFVPAVRASHEGKSAILKISEDVHIELTEGGLLRCQRALVDYANMNAIFLGSEACPDVVYFDAIGSREETLDKKVPVELKSNEIELRFVREPVLGGSSKLVVSEIKANRNVRISYDQDYALQANCVLYRLPKGLPSEENAIIRALADPEGSSDCQITYRKGDRILAKTIEVEVEKRLLRLTSPQGVLSIQNHEGVPHSLAFSSDTLLWEEREQKFLLSGAVRLKHNEALQLNTDHELSILYAVHNDEKKLRRIHSSRATTLLYLDDRQENNRHIVCPGSLMIDHERQIIVLEGERRASPAGGQQVYVEDAMGEMYADRVQIDYNWEGRRLVPTKVLLEGDVRLHNRFDGHQEESSSILHYALADRVDYWPARREMLLDGSKGRRVLFLDKVNNVQMSAPSLTVRYDTASKKEVVHGMGDVRFTFIERELLQWEQHFLSEESHDAAIRK